MPMTGARHIWGGSKRGGIAKEELEGRINVKMNLQAGALTVPELRAPVSRISGGPELYHAVMMLFPESARQLLRL